MDNESCDTCNKTGILTECNICGKWNHWRCVDPYRQPTSGDFLCGDCRRVDTDPTWSDWLGPRHECCICNERKPANQFVKVVAPGCKCPEAAGRPITCALCVYKIADASDIPTACPTCRTPLPSQSKSSQAEAADTPSELDDALRTWANFPPPRGNEPLPSSAMYT